jgi:hypothetical protein
MSSSQQHSSPKTSDHQHTASSASLDDSSSDVVVVSRHASPNAASAPSSLSYTVELFENERWFPLSGWCPKRLPSDRPHFSSKDGKTALDPLKWTIPSGYEWIGDWAIDKEHPKGNDAEGWRYGFAWATHFQPTMSGSTFVRRRRWIRTMIRPPTITTTTTTLANGEEEVKQATWDSHSNRAVTDAKTVAPHPTDIPESSLPHAQSKRAAARLRDVPSSSERVADASPSAAVVHPSPAAEIYDDATADDGETLGDDAQAPSASMRYFSERQATSSVIAGSRRGPSTHTFEVDQPAPSEAPHEHEVVGGPVTPPCMSPHAAAVYESSSSPNATDETAAASVTASQPPQRNPFAPDDDEDAAFYGFAAHHHSPRTAAAFGTAASIQVVPSGGSAIAIEHNDNALSFQRTLTEIVEDVDRSDAQDMQVWEDQQQQHGTFGGGNSSFAGSSPYLPRQHNSGVCFGGLSSSPVAVTSDPHDEDAFANMLMHFVSKAKDE